ncbi:MAG: formylmethanofuran--tetrahydromethanopterin N-formyltransferase [Methanobacteriota archaeon]|nr:MAG: formylmethanofuran--tetrahydromethanopterin N-formyltransferase [Euryarchaeota archaeon]
MEINGVVIEDAFAEAFNGSYSRFLVTAASEEWVRFAATAATGYGTSVIGCSAEAGVERYLTGGETPDRRPGAVLQVWTGKKHMLHELLGRIGQCILTAPTTAVFDWCQGVCEKVDVGRKMRFFADGYESYRDVGGRQMVSIPVMAGEFLIEEELGVGSGVMGGNFLVMGRGPEETLEASLKASEAIAGLEGVITSFPGGVCASGSKVGSRKYRFMKATTNELYCPSLRDRVQGSRVPEGVGAIAEIVVDGVSEDAVREAMRKGVEAACQVGGVRRISAANYGGSLGKVHISLHSLWR